MHNERRLTERADHIFIDSYINSIFATDGSIDQAQERGRNKSKVDTPHIYRSDITGNICDHTAPDTDQSEFAIGFKLNQLFNNSINGFLYLILFSRI